MAFFLLSRAASVAIALINTDIAANEFVYNIFSDFTVRAISEFPAAGEVDLLVIEITLIPLFFTDLAKSIVSGEYGGNENTIRTPLSGMNRLSSRKEAQLFRKFLALIPT